MSNDTTKEAIGWQPIETAPKDGTLVLASFKYRDDRLWAGFHVVGWRNGWGQWVTTTSIGFDNTGDESDNAYATHWMPLPEPPHE